jgi:hypothetical protein
MLNFRQNPEKMQKKNNEEIELKGSLYP